MQYLPDEEEQSWLIGALAGVIKARGQEHLLRMPIVCPTRRYFPDPWSFSPAGLDRVTRRLMQYADLGALRVMIVSFIENDPRAVRRQQMCRGSVAGMF